MISRDAKIFEEGSAVRARMIEYGTLFEELHIIVLNQKSKISTEGGSSPGGKNQNDIVKIKNVTIYPTDSRSILFSSYRAYKISKRIIHDSKFMIHNSVITSQDPFETGLIALMISWKFSTPLQLQIHTGFLSPYFKKESIKNKIRVLIAKNILKKADCIRVVSEKIIEGTSDVYKDIRCPVFALPIFIDAEKIKNAEPAVLPKKFDFIVLWVGRLEKEKNPMLALEAFREVLKEVPNAGLIIVGDGSERKNLESRIKNYELSKSVIVEGQKKSAAGYYKIADVLFVTSWYEGYGIQMVEARISGLSIVATDVGIARDVGAHIAGHDAESLAELLVKLYRGELKNPGVFVYPYANKEDYLRLYKKSFELCLPQQKESRS